MDNNKRIEEFIRNHKNGHFMQSQEWGRVKEDWSRHVLVSYDEPSDNIDEARIKGVMSVLVRKVPMLPFTLMYAPRGPVCDYDDADTIADLTAQVKELAKQEHAYTFKVDPDVLASDEGFKNILFKLGYKLKTSKNFEGIQPNFVFRQDISGKDEEQTMAMFQSKTRYNIRVAIKNGVTVVVSDSDDDLAKFHEIMQVTGARDRFVIRSLDYFKRLMEYLGDDARLYVARHNGEIIAGTIAINYGNKVWYLYGASDNRARNTMPNYLLQWEMMRWGIATHCDVYDFRGVSGDLTPDNPLYGLYRFKKGFGGDFTEFIGELHIDFKPFVNFCIEKILPIFMKVRSVLYLRK
ncbi:MAG: peptidoglycan bridge formation glycyltransferase FemA/FemB family protein [Clostridiales bacterium]|jgi:lipid II:glycine glycyltransferase (peptidoglycan interpeptide bridge formation enzyme)|nr:peptidoglycan bridge formation glycyltransferase FemA/FemB family protein [Clostridiales bacterium]